MVAAVLLRAAGVSGSDAYPPTLLPLMLPTVPFTFSDADRPRGSDLMSSSVCKMSTDAGTNRITVEPDPPNRLAARLDGWLAESRVLSWLLRFFAFLRAFFAFFSFSFSVTRARAAVCCSTKVVKQSGGVRPPPRLSSSWSRFSDEALL
uniref:Uncharacterized protein n=1 Tax=Anopheles darlingi TaxID=43151 RepID=A0A2M4D504_ANODA